MPGQTDIWRRALRVSLILYVSVAVLLLVADAWAYLHFFGGRTSKSYEIDDNPPPRTCAYALRDQQRQPDGTRYAQTWDVSCTFDRSKAFRPNDYPIYHLLLLADAPARATNARFLPLGALAIRALAQIKASWRDGALHVATWSGGLMDQAGRVGEVAVVLDGKE